MRWRRQIRLLGWWVWRSVRHAIILSLGVFLFGMARLGAQEVSSEAAKPKDIFDLSLDDIKKLSVTTAAKHEQSVSDAPSSITVLTRDDISKYGYRTLADVLRSVPGFYTSYDRNRLYLGVRGFNRDDYNSRVLLLVDGHRVNNNLSDGGSIGTDFILDVDLIAKVEVIRGPGSVLYGDNAFFGVINVITRRGSDLGTGELSGEYGSFDAAKGRATYGNIFKSGLEFLISGSIYDSAGPDELFYKEFDSPKNNHGVAESRNPDDFKQVFGSISFKDFTLEGAYNRRENGDPTAPFLSAFNTSQTRNIDERSYANLKFDHKFEEDLAVSAQLYYDRYDLQGDLAYIDPTFVNRAVEAGEWWGAEGQVSKKLFDLHTFTLGAEYRDDFHQEYQGLKNGVQYTDQQRTRQSYGVYLQNEITIVTNLLLNAGARYDWYSTFGDTFNPRVALIAHPWEPAVFKAIGGTAFRAPNFFELGFNSALQPETITTYELVYEQKYGPHWRSALSLYHNEIDDLISLTTLPGGSSTYKNIQGADATGAELAVMGNWSHGLSTRLSYAYQETRDSQTHHLLTDSPQHLAKANVSVPVFKENIFASLEVQYTSSRLTLMGTQASGFGLVNFTLFSRELLKGLEVSASVYNLLDKRYSDPASPFHTQDLIEQDGRTFRVKATYRF